MGIRILDIDEVHSISIEGLGLDTESLDLTSTEAIAAILRRGGGFHCPCSPRRLVRYATEALSGLNDEPEKIESAVKEILEDLEAYGDFVEATDIRVEKSDASRLLYLSPPSFVMRSNGEALLIGIASDDAQTLTEEMSAHVEFENCIRRLSIEGESDLAGSLRSFGIYEISDSAWLKEPPRMSAAEYVRTLDDRLDAAQTAYEVPGLTVIDPEKGVRYYRGRWTDKLPGNGRFVSRRSQAYGADLWCYTEVREGRPIRFIDLPKSPGIFRGCDEAWHVQAAIDAKRGAPQVYRVRDLSEVAVALDLFSPIPSWASRRWSLLGQPIPASDCLLSFKIAKSEIEDETEFARKSIWLEEI